MKPSSLLSEADPFAPLLSTPEADQLCGADGWLAAMLAAEAGLAKAQADCGLIPAEAAEAIVATCDSDFADSAEIFATGAASASPVVGLVGALAAAVPESARDWVHYGATSQDIMDTAMMLVSLRVCAHLRQDLEQCSRATAQLAERHRSTLQIGRTLGQQAAPTSFGLVAAGWMHEIDAAREDLLAAGRGLAVQLGGPVGTLESFGPQAIRLIGRFAREVGLAKPELPWHTDRTRVTRLAAALCTAIGALAKPARDVTLLSAAEYGELSEAESGGSSAMPHKRNPVSSVAILANASRAPGLAVPLWSGLQAELQRPAGAWQAEWPSLSQLLRATAGTTHHAQKLLTQLKVHDGRMKSNLDATGGLYASSTVAALLSQPLGRETAHALVNRHAAEAAPGEFRAQLSADPEVTAAVSPRQLEHAFGFESLTAASHQLIDHALRSHREKD